MTTTHKKRIDAINSAILDTSAKLANQIIEYNEYNPLTLGYAHIDKARYISRLHRIKERLQNG